MPKEFPSVTENEVVDISLADIGHSAHQIARDFRSVSQVARKLIFFDVQHQGEECKATTPKKGHSPLVRIMLEQRDQYLDLVRLQLEMSDSGAEFSDRVQVAKAIQAALKEMRQSGIDIDKAAESSMQRANELLVKLAGLAQAYQIHKEKQHMDVSSLSNEDMHKLVLASQVEVVVGDRPDEAKDPVTGEWKPMRAADV